MKTIQVIVLITTFCFIPFSHAKDADIEHAKSLLDVMGMESALENSMSAMLDFQIRQNPGLEPFENVMKAFLRKHMSYASVKPELANLYAQTFSKQEIDELIKFYSTDVGQKTINKIPELMAKGGQIGALRVQSNIGELQTMIADETDKLKSKHLSEL